MNILPLKNSIQFFLQGFLDARCHPVFYGNYFISCISWKVIILLLSQKMFYCCWQTRFHTYLSWPLWWSLSLPYQHIFSLRGSDNLFTVSGCLILCDIPSFCLCWWIFWEMGLLRWPLLFGMVSFSWIIVLMHFSALDASLSYIEYKKADTDSQNISS